jgi:prepilin-type N-terminal cleavage/methylation domain-containing protein/prepilin-type processing-associated H-X9-DG protein
MSRKRGFTLIELLVVIAVVAVLAAILFPVLTSAREKARQSACLSNCRQIGLAMMQYVEDHDGVLLPAWAESRYYLTWSSYPQIAYVPWAELIQPYLRNRAVLYCPSFNEGVLVENAARTGCGTPAVRNLFPAQYYYAHYGAAYGYSGGQCTPTKPRSRDAGNVAGNALWITLAQVVRPADTAVIQDNFTGIMATGQLAGGFGCEGGFRGAGVSRHHQGCNYVFLDGHAKLLSLDPRVEPTMECPGATIPGTSQAVANCVCTRYTTFDY